MCLQAEGKGYDFTEGSSEDIIRSCIKNSVMQARALSPKPAEPSPSCCQGFTGPRARALIFGSLRPRLQALVYIWQTKFQ